MADNIIESVEYYDYRPPVSENFNDLGTEFPIIAYNEDIVTQPCKSLLVISGKVTLKQVKSDLKNDKNAVDADITEAVTDYKPEDFRLLNNGILRFFERIDYYIGDTKIDSIRKPGIAATLKGLACFENDLKYSNTGWSVRNQENVMNSQGYFSVCIPMSIVMGFFEDYKQFLFRIPQKLVFYRTTGHFHTAFHLNPTMYPDAKINVNLKDIVWRIPQIKFNLSYTTQVRKAILNNTDYELFYRGWLHHTISGISSTDFVWDIPTAYSRTKYILIGFLSRGKDTFELRDLENVQVMLNNNVYYPRERLNLNISERRCSNLYQMFQKFKCSYYNKSEEAVEPLIDYNTFLTKYPIIAIDCSHQPDVIKESLINIKVIFNWRTVFPSSLDIHIVLISEHKAVYNPLNNRVVSG